MLEQLKKRLAELCTKAQNLRTKKQNGTWNDADTVELDAIFAEFNETNAKIEAETRTQNALQRMVAAGDQVEPPISASAPTALRVQRDAEPRQWRSNNSRIPRQFSFSDEERRLYALPENSNHLEHPSYISTFNQFLRNPRAYKDNAGGARFLQTLSEHPEAQRTYNVLRQDEDTRGGIFTLPEEMMAGILKNLDLSVHTLGLSRQITVESSDQLSIRTRTDKATFVGPRSELGNYLRTVESGVRWGKRSMKTNEFGMVALVSEQLLSHATINVWQMYQDEINLSGSEWIEQKLLYGTGLGEPLGLFTVDADNGLGVDRDISVVSGDIPASAPASWHSYDHFGYETLLRMFFALKPGHQTNGRWMFNSNQMMNLALITDPNGQYIWKPSPIDGIGGTLLGRPVIHNYWAPNVEDPEAYFGIFGNFDYNWVVWHRKMTMRTYNEILALQGMIVMLLTFQFDSQPVLPEAFVRGKYDAD